MPSLNVGHSASSRKPVNVRSEEGRFGFILYYTCQMEALTRNVSASRLKPVNVVSENKPFQLTGATAMSEDGLQPVTFMTKRWSGRWTSIWTEVADVQLGWMLDWPHNGPETGRTLPRSWVLAGQSCLWESP